MAMIDTWVCVDDEHIYPARLDRTVRWNGWVSPGFAIDAVRRLAADTAAAAEVYGHDSVERIAVIDGEPEPVVLHIRWQYLTPDDPAASVDVVKPDADGLYWIGGFEWTWYEVEDGPLFYARNAAYRAWKQVLDHTAHRIGAILRDQMPLAVSCLADLDGPGRIVRVDGVNDTWPGDQGGYGPFDSETLGEADAALQRALDHGRHRDRIEMAGWRRARRYYGNERQLHRIVFAPLAADGTHTDTDVTAVLEEARSKATEARRTLLTASAPYLARDCRAACPEARGVVVDPGTPRQFAYIVDDHRVTTASTSREAVHKVQDRLGDMFAYEPDRDDLTACGWTATDLRAVPAQAGGSYALLFPAE